MNKRFKRVICCVLSALMVISCCTGCSVLEKIGVIEQEGETPEEYIARRKAEMEFEAEDEKESEEERKSEEERENEVENRTQETAEDPAETSTEISSVTTETSENETSETSQVSETDTSESSEITDSQPTKETKDKGTKEDTSKEEPLSYMTISGLPLGHSDAIQAAYCDASSELYWDEMGILYAAEYVIDGDLFSNWQEDQDPGNGDGEWVCIHFNQAEDVTVLALWLGYGETESGYYNNNRPKGLLLEFSNGESVECSFEDARDWQYIQLSHTVTTEWIKFTLTDFYIGLKWTDTPITEIVCYH